MHLKHPLAGDGDGVAPAMVDIDGDSVPVADDGTFEVPEDREAWSRRFATAHDTDPEDLLVEKDDDGSDESNEDDGESLSFDPSEHTVDEVEEHVENIDGDDLAAELKALREAEVDGKDRSGAKKAIDSRLDDVEE